MENTNHEHTPRPNNEKDAVHFPVLKPLTQKQGSGENNLGRMEQDARTALHVSSYTSQRNPDFSKCLKVLKLAHLRTCVNDDNG